jgi:hypothetical protein
MNDDTIDMPTVYYHRSGDAFQEWTCTVEGATTYCTPPETHWYDSVFSSSTLTIIICVAVGWIAIKLAIRYGVR